MAYVLIVTILLNGQISLSTTRFDSSTACEMAAMTAARMLAETSGNLRGDKPQVATECVEAQ